jgi:hypothetical protein
MPHSVSVSVVGLATFSVTVLPAQVVGLYRSTRRMHCSPPFGVR